MAKSVKFARNVPVRHQVDVFVAGGGPAGVAAAVAAARQGASVFLAEGHSCFGGMGTAGLVPAYMTFGDQVNFLAAGIGEEILDRLYAAGGTGPDYDPRNKLVGSISIDAEALKRVYDSMMEESGAGFAFHTSLVAVETAAAKGRALRPVTAAICAGKSGMFAVQAKVYIDGTGDGDLAAWAGAPFEKGDQHGDMMPGTLCSLWANVNWPTVRSSGLGAGNARLEKAIKDGVVKQDDMHLPGMWRIGKDVGGGNIGHTFGVDGTDERSVTKALLFGRKLVLQYEQYYKQCLKGFERMKLMATGSLLGLRESRRIMGDYVLCLNDFKARAVFADEIGRNAYPVDIHVMRPGAKAYGKFIAEWESLRYKPGESHGIPYRSLVPRKLSNVLVAGRCISADRHLQGSVRTMPTCYVMGQAAGVAAAMAAGGKGEVRAIDVPELQRRLKALGAFLPNAKV